MTCCLTTPQRCAQQWLRLCALFVQRADRTALTNCRTFIKKKKKLHDCFGWRLPYLQIFPSLGTHIIYTVDHKCRILTHAGRLIKKKNRSTVKQRFPTSKFRVKVLVQKQKNQQIRPSYCALLRDHLILSSCCKNQTNSDRKKESKLVWPGGISQFVLLTSTRTEKADLFSSCHHHQHSGVKLYCVHVSISLNQ